MKVGGSCLRNNSTILYHKFSIRSTDEYLTSVCKEIYLGIFPQSTTTHLPIYMENTFDYVIIGAGSAGTVLANRLSAKSANRVLLLEAGGNQYYCIRIWMDGTSLGDSS